MLFDLAFDYASTPRLAVAKADQCSDEAFNAAVSVLQAAGIAVSQLDEVTQSNAARVEESAASASELRHRASRLAAAVGVLYTASH